MKRVSINYPLILLSLFYIIMLQPEGLSLNPALNKLFTLAKLGMAGLALVLYFYYNRISFAQVILILFEISLICSTLLYGTEIKFVCKNAIFTIGFCLATDLGIRFFQRETLRAFYWVSYLYIFINFLTVFLYPDGWWISNGTQAHWFLGQKNMIIILMIPSLISGLVSLAEQGRKISFDIVLLSLICVISIFMTKSSTSIVMMVIFVLFYILYVMNVNYIQIFNIRNYVWAILSANIFVLFASRISVLRWFVTVVLKKTLHFTGRATIWEHAIQWILKSPVFGWGYEHNTIITEKLGGNPAFVSCHNYFLNIAYKQGIIGLIFIFILYIIFVKSLKVTEGYAFTQLVGVGVFLLLFCGIFESLGWGEPLLWLVFLGIYYRIPEDMKEKGI